MARYDGPTRSLLIAFKERGAVGLARPLGDALGRSVGAVLTAAALRPETAVVVVPVPSAPGAVRRRGDDVVQLLARRAALRLRAAGHRVRVVAALLQARKVADSAGLTARARADNLAGALAIRAAAQRRLDGAAIVLVDDLVTTGATLAEATAVLVGGGGHVLGAAAIAATRRRSAAEPTDW
ncbi:MAG TPA: ComF family protein [Mycobacteriales bacterium]|nr:ComF family protein [Mycobacteriales bacterium]